MSLLKKYRLLAVKWYCLTVLCLLNIRLISLDRVNDEIKNIPEYFGVDFMRSMMIYQIRVKPLDKNNQKTKLLMSLYDNFIIKNLDYASEPRIPKVIHQIWIGGKLPEKYHAWQQSWIKNHSDWLYILWDDEAIEKLDLDNKELYKAAKSYSAKSDIARYEIIYRFGGVYLDMDFECLRPFDIFHHCCDFYAGCDANGVRIFSTPLGARPGHPILKACIEHLSKLSGQSVDGDITGPHLVTECFYDVINQCTDRCVIFPLSYFFPFPVFARFATATSTHKEVKKRIKPESFAIHYWHSSWRPGKFK